MQYTTTHIHPASLSALFKSKQIVTFSHKSNMRYLDKTVNRNCKENMGKTHKRMMRTPAMVGDEIYHGGGGG